MIRVRIFFLLLVPMAVTAAEDRVLFNRDVRPLIAEYCYHCHGPDPGSRKEGIRFDREEGFFGKREDSEPAVVKTLATRWRPPSLPTTRP